MATKKNEAGSKAITAHWTASEDLDEVWRAVDQVSRLVFRESRWKVTPPLIVVDVTAVDRDCVCNPIYMRHYRTTGDKVSELTAIWRHAETIERDGRVYVSVRFVEFRG